MDLRWIIAAAEPTLCMAAQPCSDVPCILACCQSYVRRNERLLCAHSLRCQQEECSALWNSAGDTLIKKKNITVHPMKWGLTKFQNDYISAGETFCPKTSVPFEPDETNLAMQLLSDLSFWDSL